MLLLAKSGASGNLQYSRLGLRETLPVHFGHVKAVFWAAGLATTDEGE